MIFYSSIKDLIFLIIIILGSSRSIYLLLRKLHENEKPYWSVYFYIFYFSLLYLVSLCLSILGYLTPSGILITFSGLLIFSWYLKKPVFVNIESLLKQMRSLGWPSIVIFFLFTILLVQVLVQPVSDYDSLNYHGRLLAKFVQGTENTFIFNDEIAKFYPFGWELILTIFTMPFASTQFATIPGWIAAIALIQIIYIACNKQLNLSKQQSTITTISVLSLTQVHRLVNSYYADLIFSIIFIATLFSIIRFFSQGHRISFYSTLMGISLLFAIKGSALLNGTLLAILFIFAWWHQRHAFKVTASTLFSITIPILLASLWYSRNFILYNNPIGVIKLNILGWHLPGIFELSFIQKGTLAKTFSVFNLQHIKALLFGLLKEYQISMLIMIAAVVTSYSYWRVNIRVFFTVIILMTILTTIHWHLPFSSDFIIGGKITNWIGGAFRYSLPLFYLLAILAAPSWNKKYSFYALSLMILSVLIHILLIDAKTDDPFLFNLNGIKYYITHFSELSQILPRLARHLLPYFLVILISIAIAISIYRIQKVLFLVSIILMLLILPILSRYESTQRRVYVYGTTVSLLDSRPEIHRIGYLLSHLPLPLAGENLKRKLIPLKPDYKNIQTFINTLNNRYLHYLVVGPIESGLGNTEILKNKPVINWLENNSYFKRISGPNQLKIIQNSEWKATKSKGYSLYQF